MFRLRRALAMTHPTTKASALKYWLFDAAVALALGAGALALWRGAAVDGRAGHPAVPSRCPDGDCRHEPQANSRRSLASSSSGPAFRVGDLVEVHDPSVHGRYAFTAQVAKVYPPSSKDCVDPSGGVMYDVRSGVGGTIYSHIAASSVHPLGEFEPQSRAMCEDGPVLNARLFPCTVDYRMPTTLGRSAVYSVSLEIEEGEWQKRHMPVSRIRRIMQDEDHEQAEQEASHDFQEEDSPEAFPVGTVVEVHGPGGYFAFPATVTGINQQRYDLSHGVTRAPLQDVDARFVHPYQVYADGTRASCHVGKRGRIYLVPCTVLGHADEREGAPNGDLVYRVSAKMSPEQEEAILFLPRLRVQRRVEHEEAKAS